LKKLFHGAESTRQRDDAITKLIHFRFPLMHRLDDEKFGQPVMCDLPGLEETGQYAYHLSAMTERPVGNRAHQAYFGTAIHQSQAGFGQCFAQQESLLFINAVRADARTAENDDIVHGRYCSWLRGKSTHLCSLL